MEMNFDYFSLIIGTIVALVTFAVGFFTGQARERKQERLLKAEKRSDQRIEVEELVSFRRKAKREIADIGRRVLPNDSEALELVEKLSADFKKFEEQVSDLFLALADEALSPEEIEELRPQIHLAKMVQGELERQLETARKRVSSPNMRSVGFYTGR